MSDKFMVRASDFVASSIPFYVVMVHKMTKTRVYYQERHWPEATDVWTRVTWLPHSKFLPTLFTSEEDAKQAASKAVNAYAGMISTLRSDIAEMNDKLQEIYETRRQLIIDSELGTK